MLTQGGRSAAVPRVVRTQVPPSRCDAAPCLGSHTCETEVIVPTSQGGAGCWRHEEQGAQASPAQAPSMTAVVTVAAAEAGGAGGGGSDENGVCRLSPCH